MASNNSLVMTFDVISKMLTDVSHNYNMWFPSRNCRLTIDKIAKRIDSEGLAFLTKTLPRLGKSFDKALSGIHKLDCLRFQKKRNTDLPMFMGEFFERVFTKDGWIRPDPCCSSVSIIRQVLYLFYKLELPYNEHEEKAVTSDFVATDGSLPTVGGLKEGEVGYFPISILEATRFHCVGHYNPRTGYSRIQSGNANSMLILNRIRHRIVRGRPRRTILRRVIRIRAKDNLNLAHSFERGWEFFVMVLRPCATVRRRDQAARRLPVPSGTDYRRSVAMVAKKLLTEVLCNFDPYDIVPRHGPGAVSTGEKNWEKFGITVHYGQIAEQFPYDAYFYVSPSHVCDEMLTRGSRCKLETLPSNRLALAKVCLVPKDSRGPRLISCEPKDFQWIQQGIGRKLMQHIEDHALTRGLVNFTDQAINQKLALQGSVDDSYATIDLKEASDRVSHKLVRELWPSHVVCAMEAVRTAGTRLPNGEIVILRKWAPMGSMLCFPVMALTLWAIGTACLLLKHGRKRPSRDDNDCVYVYGDDVIIRKAQASDIINVLPMFDLKVNVDKSFLQGSFKESCGTDAFMGVEVQPVRVKTVWTSSATPGAFSSYVSYANSLWKKGFRSAAMHIAHQLRKLYGPIPDKTVIGSQYTDGTDDKRDTIHRYPSFCFDADTTDRLKRRFNKNLQRFEYLVWSVSPKKVNLESYSGWNELLRYLTSGSQEFVAGEYAIQRCSMLQRRWR